MQGRFFSYAYLISVIILMVEFSDIDSSRLKLPAYGIICLYLGFYSHTPFTSPYNYHNDFFAEYNNEVRKTGIADERGVYFKKLSLFAYIFRDKDRLFPDILWAHSGNKFKEDNKTIMVPVNIGVFGYFSGTKKIIVDRYALSDPLLARLPVTGPWRIGHFARNIPDGYIQSVRNNTEVITDPRLNAFYKKLKLVTQSEEFFAIERIKTIVLLNLIPFEPTRN